MGDFIPYFSLIIYKGTKRLQINGILNRKKIQEFDGIYEVVQKTSIRELLNSEFELIYDDENMTYERIMEPSSLISISCKRGDIAGLIKSIGGFNQLLSQQANYKGVQLTYIGLLKSNDSFRKSDTLLKTNNRRLKSVVILMTKLTNE